MQMRRALDTKMSGGLCANESGSGYRSTPAVPMAAKTDGSGDAAMLETLNRIAETLGITAAAQGISLTCPMQVVTVNSQRTQHSLVLRIPGNNNRDFLIDTGSSYTIITRATYLLMKEQGVAGELLDKSDNIRFVSATDSDLGCSNDAKVSICIGSVMREVKARTCTNFGDIFPVLLGMDAITALGGVVNTRNNTVSFLDGEMGAADTMELVFDFGDCNPNDGESTNKTATAVAWSRVMSVSIAVNAKPTDCPAALFAKFASDDLKGPETEVPFSNWHPLAELQCPVVSDEGCQAELSANKYNRDFEIPASFATGNGDRQDNVFHRTHQAPSTLVDSNGSTTFTHTKCEKGHIVATTITERTVDPQNNSTATLCIDSKGVTAATRPVTSDDHSSVNPVYRTAEGDMLWQQLGLDDNDWANVSANRIIMEGALETNTNVFRPNDDGSLRRMHRLDGTPIEIGIVLEEGTQVHSKAYRVNEKWAVQVEERIRDIHRLGLIAPHGSICSPLLVVPKGTDGIRLTVDYRKVNKRIRPYTYPLTTCEDIFSRCGGATCFTTLDFKDFFYQFWLTPASREVKTFATPTQGNWM